MGNSMCNINTSVTLFYCKSLMSSQSPYTCVSICTHTHTHTHPHTHAHTHAHTHPHQKPLRSQQPSPQEPVWTSGAFLSSSAERLRTPLPPHPLVRCPLGLSV